MRKHHSIVVVSLALVVAFSSCARHRSVTVVARKPADKQVYNAGTPQDLSEYIRSVLKISQENTEAADTALRALFQRRPELADLKRHVDATPDDVVARKLLAAAYLDEGLPSPAFRLYQEVIQQAPNDSVAELGIARVWNEWGDLSMAGQHAERALALNPQSTRSLELLGRIHLKRNELDAAISSFVSALKIDPDNAPLLSNVGYAYMSRGDWIPARDYLRRAVMRDQSLQQAQNNLGIVLVKLGDRTGALGAFMVVNRPAAAYNNLGVAYLSERRLVDARDAFKRSLALDPSYEKARENLAYADARLPRSAVVDLPPLDSTVGSSGPAVRTEISLPAMGERARRVADVAPAKTQPATERVREASSRDSRYAAAYKDAIAKFGSRQYRECIAILQWLKAQRPAGSMAINSEYWMGESYFVLGQYSKAIDSFQRVAREATSPRKRDAMLMMKKANALLRRNSGKV
jgi:Flp pilus assembly protein TadD